jgi:hypothetical protein
MMLFYRCEAAHCSCRSLCSCLLYLPHTFDGVLESLVVDVTSSQLARRRMAKTSGDLSHSYFTNAGGWSA